MLQLNRLWLAAQMARLFAGLATLAALGIFAGCTPTTDAVSGADLWTELASFGADFLRQLIAAFAL